MKALEKSFPFEELDAVAEKESYRKEVNRPIYHTHKWWAQRLGSVFRMLTLGTLLDEDEELWKEFYKKHKFNNSIILDPFMGSGTTIGESIKLGSKAIGCDINPVSSFIVSQAFKNISKTKLLEAFYTIEAKVKSKIKHFYTKVHPVTGELCEVLYYFWVKEVELPNGKRIPLFSNYIFSKNAYPDKKPISQIICPNCGNIITAHYKCEYVECIKCSSNFNPQDGPAKGQTVYDNETGESYKIIDLIKNAGTAPKHKLYASMILNKNGTKEYLPIDEHDIRLLEEAKEELKNHNFPYPQGRISPGNNATQVLKYNYSSWSDFFNERQLLCLSLLLDSILQLEDEDVREAFICLFSGTLEFNNMFCSFKGEGTGAVRHMFYNHILKPEKTPLENSVWGSDKGSGTFLSLFKSRLIKAQEYRQEPFEIRSTENGDTLRVVCSDPININYVNSFEELKNTDNSCLILNGDSSYLPLPDSSVDAVVTDPPYFDFVHYSELSDFFYAWLKPVLSNKYHYFNRDNSRRKGEVQHKESDKFSNALGEVFVECSRVLKNEGLLVFSFHHSKFEGWNSIYKAIAKAGLRIKNVYPVKAEMSVGTPKSATKDPINLDALIVCKKENLEKEYNFSIEDVKDISLSELKDLELRFLNTSRKLSLGDRRVILSSLLLKNSSLARISPESLTEEFDDKLITNLLELKEEYVS
ncbi:hypothetical protein BH09BAC4_BH09BAC4_17060 [soil metagenome]